MLTLGCVCLRNASALPGDDCTGGGYLAFGAADSLSLSGFAESIVFLVIVDCDKGVLWVVRFGNDCSFDGGAGGSSTSWFVG